MRHCSNEPLDRANRDPGVGIKRDDITNAGRPRGRRAVLGEEGRVGHSTQQAIQLVELSALPFPSHPYALARVPEPAAMENVETRAAAGCGAMRGVQPRDTRADRKEDGPILRHRLSRSVDPVGDHREPHISIRVREVVYFETLELLFDVAETGQERRHCDDRAKLLRHAGIPLESRQEIRHHDCGDEAIEKPDRKIGRRHDRQSTEDGQRRSPHLCGGKVQRHRENGRGQ